MAVMKIFILLTCLLPVAAFSQGDIRTVKTEQQINDVFSVKDIFRYEAFTSGKVYFKDGTAADARLNYNRVFEQMLFVDEKGDTLAMAAPELTQVVVIGKDSFYYGNEFFLEKEPIIGKAKMATRQLLKQIDKKTLGAYGSTNSDAANSSFKQQYTIDGKAIQMKPGEGTLYSKTTEIYISDEFNHFLPLTKKNLELIFRQHLDGLKEFIKANDINLKKVDDVKRLIAFANQL